LGLLDRARSLFGRGDLPSASGIRIPREAAARAAPRLEELRTRLTELAGLPGLEAFADGHQLPRAFADGVAHVYEAYDAFADELCRAVPLQTTCAAGCAHCCNDAPTPVRGYELLAIYAVTHPRRRFRKLHNRAAELAERFTGELVAASGGRTAVKSDSKPFIAARMAYLRAKQPCVFLDRQRRTCTVYDVRPLACRMHFSLDDPDLCDPAREAEPQTPNLAPPEPLVEIMRRVDERLGLTVSPVLPVGFAELGALVMKGEPILWEIR